MKQCEYEKTRRLMFVVHTRGGERGEEKRERRRKAH
jgi:hypothetical protein